MCLHPQSLWGTGLRPHATDPPRRCGIMSDLAWYDAQIKMLIEEGTSKKAQMKADDVVRILADAKEVFLAQPSMLELAS